MASCFCLGGGHGLGGRRWWARHLCVGIPGTSRSPCPCHTRHATPLATQGPTLAHHSWRLHTHVATAQARALMRRRGRWWLWAHPISGLALFPLPLGVCPMPHSQCVFPPPPFSSLQAHSHLALLPHHKEQKAKDSPSMPAATDKENASSGSSLVAPLETTTTTTLVVGLSAPCSLSKGQRPTPRTPSLILVVSTPSTISTHPYDRTSL